MFIGKRLCIRVTTWSAVLAVLAASERSRENLVEIMTEAPPSVGALHSPKDCYVYDARGNIRAVHRHGEEWLNDDSSCERCRCTDGAQSCLFEYCNSGITTGYITPPSSDKDKSSSSDTVPPIDDEDAPDYEGSGRGLALYLDEEVNSVHHQMPRFDVTFNEVGEAGFRKGDPFGGSRVVFCNKKCSKYCHRGYQIDPRDKCLLCKCVKCRKLTNCFLKCPTGLSTDSNGCKVCSCGAPKTSTLVGDDRGGDFTLEGSYLASPEGLPSYPADDEDERNRIKDVVVQRIVDPSRPADPSCTGSRHIGCLDSEKEYPVGKRWSKGPCVTCICWAQGQSQCNVTHCPGLACPPERSYRPHNSCCSVCAVPLDRLPSSPSYDSRSTSRVPPDLLPVHGYDTSVRADVIVDNLATKIVAHDDLSVPRLCLIVLPVLLLFTLMALLALHFWRKYHRDKYDINDFRPEETQTLRPVKTLPEIHRAKDHRLLKDSV